MPQSNTLLLSTVDRISYSNLLSMQYNESAIDINVDNYRKLYNDIFAGTDYAENFRTTNLWKGIYFLEPKRIESSLEDALDLFNKWKDLNKTANKLDLYSLCKFYAYLNFIHPFKNGNGRTQREFLRRILIDCGYTFDLSHTHHIDMVRASFKAVRFNDLTELETIFKEAINRCDNTDTFYKNLCHLAILSSDDIEIGSRISLKENSYD